MASLGFKSLRARRRGSPPADIQITALGAHNSHRRHTPVTEEPDLKGDEDGDTITVLDVSEEASDDDDDDYDDAAATPSSTPSATATVFPTTYLSETSTTILPTISSSPLTSAIWMTGIPVQASSFSTRTTSCQTVAGGQHTDEPGGHHSGNDSPEGPARTPSRPDGTRTKVAIAFGTIGAVGLIVAIIWVALLIRRRRRRHGQHEANSRDDPSHMDQRRRFNPTFNVPSIPRLPFSFASPLVRFNNPDPDATSRQVSSPSNPVYISGHRNAPSNPSIVGETTQVTVRANDGESGSVLKGWMDEKRHDPGYPLPLLDPEPVPQASIRSSIVSWFRRSSKHHPLRLNPLSWKSSRSSTASNLTGGNLMSGPGSIASTSRTNTGYHTDSGESVVAEGSGSGNTGMLEALPPMPDLGLQSMYSSDATTAPTPTDSAEASVTAPLPAFTREDARAYYKSIWAESSAAGNSERMSAMSSWTESTTRTSTQGIAGRESMEQAGLSPPPGHASSSLKISTQMPAGPGPVATTATAGINGTTGSPGVRTTVKELYAVYEQT